MVHLVCIYFMGEWEKKGGGDVVQDVLGERPIGLWTLSRSHLLPALHVMGAFVRVHIPCPFFLVTTAFQGEAPPHPFYRPSFL